MSFPLYPKYKASGVEWLGDVPEHWEVKRLSSVCRFQPGKAHEPFIDDTGEFVCVNSRFVSTEGKSRKFCSKNLSPAQKSDILMVMSDLPNGRALAKAYFVNDDTRYAVNQRVCILSPQSANPKYLFYLLNRNRFFLQHDDGANQTHLPNEAFEKFKAPLPPSSQQTAIAAFLDRETAKIDELVNEQRRLMELLKEKRQAVISNAVTRGLNPDAPLKSSGIEWLGHVPKHWAVTSVRRVIQRIEQGWSPDCLGRPAEVEEWGVVKSGCVNRGVFVEQENKGLPDTLEPIPEYEIRVGDVLMSRASGSPELVGSTAYIAATRPKLMLSDKIFRIHPEPTIHREFFVALFNSRVMRSQIERAISGADGLANNLPQSAMKAFFCLVPPLNEQEDIVSHLSSELTKFDTLTIEAQRAIDLLQERRTALISAAVTGQIDVRT